jgi:hypothetical protein
MPQLPCTSMRWIGSRTFTTLVFMKLMCASGGWSKKRRHEWQGASSHYDKINTNRPALM